MSFDSLIAIYRTQPAARQLFEWILANEVEENRTTVEGLVEQVGISRKQAITALRTIAEAGFGEFKVGRKGHPSRLEWAEDPRALAERLTNGPTEVAHQFVEMDEELDEESSAATPAAAGEGMLEMFSLQAPAAQAPGRARRRATTHDASLIEHSYVLRPNLRLSFSLPEDLTAREAEVLAGWIANLSFER